MFSSDQVGFSTHQAFPGNILKKSVKKGKKLFLSVPLCPFLFYAPNFILIVIVILIQPNELIFVFISLDSP